MLVWALVAIGVVSAAVVAVLIVTLVRRLSRLGASAQRLAEDLPPILAEIQRDSERARQQMERLSESLPDAGR